LEHNARFDEITINLPEPLGTVDSMSAVVGIPEWWPTGARVAVALAHDSSGNMNDPLIECLHRQLAHRKFLTIRFNFPFAEAGTPATEDTAEALEMAYRAALSILGRDSATPPAHLFLGGVGLGARVTARLATARLQIDGAFFLGYPLHPPDKPKLAHADHLYRIIAPMLFVQGTQDRRCDLNALRRCLQRVGAPTTLRTVDEADHTLVPPDWRGESPVEVKEMEGESAPIDDIDDPGRAISESVALWMERILSGH
jgi:predicted alpha/beta-hydrolase family hydrolase